jgi:uncharacterized protein (TIGR01319 family)
MTSILDADTLLGVDVGSVNTRAHLFDVVDGRYRLVASGRASSTGGAPLFDIGEGVRMALDQVMEVTGRRLIDESEALIIPSTSAGTGSDVFVASSSAGPSLKVALVGLMPGVSLESANRLAASTYLDVVAEVNLMDGRREEEQLDLILSSRPDLILLVGGTDGGATSSVLRMVESVAMAASLFQESRRPIVVFAGNRTLGASVTDRFGEGSALAIVPNIRPSLSQDDLAPARLRLADVIRQARSTKVAGLDELDQWTAGNLMLSGDALGRVVRYLSQIYDPDKGVLGVDLGASHTVVAAGFEGDLRLSVSSDLGIGSSAAQILEHIDIEHILQWLPVEISEVEARDYVLNKSLYPSTIPAEVDDLHLEYALAREIIRVAVARARKNWPEEMASGGREFLPPLEPIIGSGGVLARSPRPGHAALVMLDALQPTGISTLVLDPYNLLPTLGAAAANLPMVTVQVLESGSFVSLGTVIAPVGRGRTGRPALRVRLDKEGASEPIEGQVKFGQLAVLPLRQGEVAQLTVRPERGFDVGFGGPGKGAALKVTGGAVGLIIDARGRPLRLPRDATMRRELNQKWLWDIGAME